MKTSSRKPLLIVILAGLSLFSAIVLYFVTGNSAQQNIPAIESEQISALSVGRPVRLKIPVINVNATVEYVGLTSNGEMDTPSGPTGVAWFELGPRPGEKGSAVIAGHYGRWKSGERSVFENLNKLKKGDVLYIEDDGGLTLTFTVRESRSYDPSADAFDVFSLNDGKSHLNLVTCEGVWNAASQTYSQRLVVFTDKE
jgi:LPXTG-site transpeptidase (sortase) family protein